MSFSFKKISFAVLLFSATAFAAVNINQEQVNAKVAEILQPFNNLTTKASLLFTELRVDEVRALGFGLEAFYEKLGSQNKLTIAVSNASYQYGDGSKPKVNADVYLGLDLIKAFGQDIVNEYARALKPILEDIGNELSQQYGDAALVKAEVLEMITDKDENVLSAKMKVDIVVDISKIKDPALITNMEIQAATITLSAGQNGVGGNFEFVLNPAYIGFQKDGEGLKEYIDALLNGDTDRFAEIQNLARILDSIAKELVERKN